MKYHIAAGYNDMEFCIRKGQQAKHIAWIWVYLSNLQWRHNERDGVSNHRCLDYLLNGFLRHKSKKASKLCVTGLCEGNSPVTGEFSTQKSSNAENVSIGGRHHEFFIQWNAYASKSKLLILFRAEIYQMYVTGDPKTWFRNDRYFAHDDVIKIIVRVPVCEGNSPVTIEFPVTKASDAEFWCFLWSAPQQKVEQTIEPPVIWVVITLIMTSL